MPDLPPPTPDTPPQATNLPPRTTDLTPQAADLPPRTTDLPLRAPDLPPRTRGVIALLEANCTVCMICARECPDWCIHIDSHTEVEQQPGSARPRARNVLDRFAIDYGQCLYCGICVEACPFDALHWAPDFSYPGTGTLDGHGAVAELVHERDVLNMWVDHVPPPPVLDTQAEPAPETGATRPGRAGSGTPGRPGALRGRT